MQKPGVAEQVSAACREELVLWWRQGKRDTHTLPQPASPPLHPHQPPQQQPHQKRNIKGWKREEIYGLLAGRRMLARWAVKTPGRMSHLWRGWTAKWIQWADGWAFGAFPRTPQCWGSLRHPAMVPPTLCAVPVLSVSTEAFSEWKAFEDGRPLGLWKPWFYRKDPVAFAALSPTYLENWPLSYLL